MNRRRKDKRRAQTDHTIRRLKERYGLKYTQQLRDHALHQIHSSKATFVLRQSLRVTVWDVEYDVKEHEIIDPSLAKEGPVILRLVYDSHRKNLVTVLTTDMNPEDLACYEDFY